MRKAYANSKDTDRQAKFHSLIRAFAKHRYIIGLLYTVAEYALLLSVIQSLHRWVTNYDAKQLLEDDF